MGDSPGSEFHPDIRETPTQRGPEGKTPVVLNQLREGPE